MQSSLNSPHGMGGSMSPVGSPYMAPGSSVPGMGGGSMTQCMGNSMGVAGAQGGLTSRYCYITFIYFNPIFLS